MSKDARIRVGVEGAEKAKGDLKGVRGQVDDLGEAGKKSAAGTREASAAAKDFAGAQEQAGQAAKDTAEGIDAFDKKGSRAARQIVTLFNPAFAGIIAIIQDVAPHRSISHLVPREPS